VHKEWKNKPTINPSSAPKFLSSREITSLNLMRKFLDDYEKVTSASLLEVLVECGGSDLDTSEVYQEQCSICSKVASR
jgi:hypothetical protein